MLFWTGTANVENGSATASVDTGPALTAEVAARYSMAVLDGIVYFVDSLTDTSTFELTRDYAGGSGTVSLEIWPVSPEVSDLVRLAQVVARTQAQINVLDKNSQGLFYQMKSVTGAADPGPGFVAFDHGDAASVTEAYIDVLDANGRAVAGLLGLWEAGTTLVLRSLTTTAYRAYAVASFTDEGGWVRLGLAYLGHDGVLADNEALALSWTRAAAGLAIDATGFFADRDIYDDEPGGFVFLSADGDGTPGSLSALYRKASSSSGDWGPAVPFQGPQGDKGWSPLFSAPVDGERRVLRLFDWTGGQGSKPASGQYLGPGGLVTAIGSATDFRGVQGLSAFQVAVVNGFPGSQSDWLASLVGPSAYEVAVANGFVGTEPEWLASLVGSLENVTSFWQGRLLVDTTAAAARTGLGIVLASQGEAELGTDNTRYMTPLRTAQAIQVLSPPTDLTPLETNDALLTLTLADLQGQRLGMVGGIADPFDDESGIDAIASSNYEYDADADLVRPSVVLGTDQTATHTAATVSGNTVSASSTLGASSTHLPWQAFDKVVPATDVATGWTSANGSTTGWLQYQFATPKLIGSYTIQAHHQSFGIGRAPRDWTLQGSDTGAFAGEQVVLDTRSSQTAWALREIRTFTISDPQVFTYYRIVITSNNGDAQYLHIGEMTLVSPDIVEEMSLTSVMTNASAQPQAGRFIVQIDTSEIVDINDDLIVELSRDDGGTWALGNLELISSAGTISTYQALGVDLSGQPSGGDMRYRIRTFNGKSIGVTGVVQQWR